MLTYYGPEYSHLLKVDPKAFCSDAYTGFAKRTDVTACCFCHVGFATTAIYDEHRCRKKLEHFLKESGQVCTATNLQALQS
jgi:hypothetical protein